MTVILSNVISCDECILFKELKKRVLMRPCTPLSIFYSYNCARVFVCVCFYFTRFLAVRKIPKKKCSKVSTYIEEKIRADRCVILNEPERCKDLDILPSCITISLGENLDWHCKCGTIQSYNNGKTTAECREFCYYFQKRFTRKKEESWNRRRSHGNICIKLLFARITWVIPVIV